MGDLFHPTRDELDLTAVMHALSDPARRKVVATLAAEGERAITGIPPNRRMDAASAEKLIALVPQLASGFGGSGGRGGGGASAAVTSRRLWQAASAFERLVSKEGVTSEALIHAGQLYVRLARPGEALLLFQRADVAAATPYESYLARTLGGAVLERVGRRDDAIVSFLGALEVVPRAQSATLALAPLLFETGKREEAADLIEEAVRLPVVADPLQYYWQGDPDAVWRALVQLRKAFK